MAQPVQIADNQYNMRIVYTLRHCCYYSLKASTAQYNIIILDFPPSYPTKHRPPTLCTDMITRTYVTELASWMTISF